MDNFIWALGGAVIGAVVTYATIWIWVAWEMRK